MRGIYDNMKTAVTTVFTGKERVFNRRFLIMTDHYMIEPTACSPGCRLGEGPGRASGADRPRPLLPAPGCGSRAWRFEPEQKTIR